MTRTDIHRPSAIVPSEYEFVEFAYQGPFDFDAPRRAAHINKHMECTGGRYSNHEHGGSCHICGAHAQYMAVFYHKASNTYIRTGMDCADKMEFAYDNPTAFRKEVRAAIDQIAGKRKAEAIIAQEGLNRAWEIFNMENRPDKWEEDTIVSIVSNLVKYGNISQRQCEFIKTLFTKIDGRAAVNAAQAAIAALSNYIGECSERRVFKGIITLKTSYDTIFGIQYLTSITDEVGNVIVYKGSSNFFNEFEKGMTVEFKATVKEHSEYKTIKQTIVSRPVMVK